MASGGGTEAHAPPALPCLLVVSAESQTDVSPSLLSLFTHEVCDCVYLCVCVLFEERALCISVSDVGVVRGDVCLFLWGSAVEVGGGDQR